MQIDQWLAQVTQKLEQMGVGTARLDALVLLEDVMGLGRAHLLAHPDTKIAPAQQTKLKKLLSRRQNHEPLAYIRGKTEFYGREFIINQNVLEPRPESETMIDLLKELFADPNGVLKQVQDDEVVKIADVGAGSGALGITALLELPKTQVELLEIDKKAVTVAKMNVDKFTLDITVKKSDLLDSSRQNNDILLCNLPYVPDSHTVNRAVLKEPKIAIFGGQDGLNLYRKLFAKVQKLAKQPLFILTEALPPQHAKLATIAKDGGYKLTQTDDFIQLFTTTKI